MSDAYPAPDDLKPADAVVDPLADVFARGIARMSKLSDKIMAMAMALPEDGEAESADSMAKLSRAVRLTTASEIKIAEALAARLAGEVTKREETKARAKAAEPPTDFDPAAEDPYAFIKAGKKGRARELLIDVADHEIPDAEEYDQLIDALDERLIYDSAYNRLDDIAMKDIVRNLCCDLKLRVDWKRWHGDGWLPDPLFWRPRSSQFLQPSRVPILGGGADDPDDPDPLE
jgi:hypothetical protein